MSYVYIESERWTDEHGLRHVLYTVGFYKPDGKFEPESDHGTKQEAADRVAWLNGGAPQSIIEAICEAAGVDLGGLADDET
ncbi:MAG: hypothetical protein AMJ84_04605 [Acidithiobacillales bacterium SM23_46]|nr:MAG: hypothetical protein AMJ84_04605 [Acidithiobacillales bacterium SM23_46]